LRVLVILACSELAAGPQDNGDSPHECILRPAKGAQPRSGDRPLIDTNPQPVNLAPDHGATLREPVLGPESIEASAYTSSRVFE
jgi:hypothetical protein